MNILLIKIRCDKTVRSNIFVFLLTVCKNSASLIQECLEQSDKEINEYAINRHTIKQTEEHENPRLSIFLSGFLSMEHSRVRIDHAAMGGVC